MKFRFLFFIILCSSRLLLAQNQPSLTGGETDEAKSSPLMFGKAARFDNSDKRESSYNESSKPRRSNNPGGSYGATAESDDTSALLPRATAVSDSSRRAGGNSLRFDKIRELAQLPGHDNDIIIFENGRLNISSEQPHKLSERHSKAINFLRSSCQERATTSKAPDSMALFHNFVFPDLSANQGCLTLKKMNEVIGAVDALDGVAEELRGEQSEIDLNENEIIAQAVAKYAKDCYDADEAAHKKLTDELSSKETCDCIQTTAAVTCCMLATAAICYEVCPRERREEQQQTSVSAPGVTLIDNSWNTVYLPPPPSMVNYSNEQTPLFSGRGESYPEIRNQIRAADVQRQKSKKFYDDAVAIWNKIKQENSSTIPAKYAPSVPPMVEAVPIKSPTAPPMDESE